MGVDLVLDGLGQPGQSDPVVDPDTGLAQPLGQLGGGQLVEVHGELVAVGLLDRRQVVAGAVLGQHGQDLGAGAVEVLADDRLDRVVLGDDAGGVPAVAGDEQEALAAVLRRLGVGHQDHGLDQTVLADGVGQLVQVAQLTPQVERVEPDAVQGDHCEVATVVPGLWSGRLEWGHRGAVGRGVNAGGEVCHLVPPVWGGSTAGEDQGLGTPAASARGGGTVGMERSAQRPAAGAGPW